MQVGSIVVLMETRFNLDTAMLPGYELARVWKQVEEDLLDPVDVSDKGIFVLECRFGDDFDVEVSHCVFEDVFDLVNCFLRAKILIIRDENVVLN